MLSGDVKGMLSNLSHRYRVSNFLTPVHPQT